METDAKSIEYTNAVIWLFTQEGRVDVRIVVENYLLPSLIRYHDRLYVRDHASNLYHEREPVDVTNAEVVKY